VSAIERAKHLVGTREAHVIAVSASDVTEGLGDESFPHADGTENDDVSMRFEKAQAHELREHALVEADFRSLVPEL
jgi:hypothetical protein